jgi:hypothetical protein
VTHRTERRTEGLAVPVHINRPTLCRGFVGIPGARTLLFGERCSTVGVASFARMVVYEHRRQRDELRGRRAASRVLLATVKRHKPNENLYLRFITSTLLVEAAGITSFPPSGRRTANSRYDGGRTPLPPRHSATMMSERCFQQHLSAEVSIRIDEYRRKA